MASQVDQYEIRRKIRKVLIPLFILSILSVIIIVKMKGLAFIEPVIIPN